MNIKQALHSWDGKSAIDIKAIYDQYSLEENFVNDILELSQSQPYEVGTTWLLKAWLEEGNKLSSSQVSQLYKSLNHLEHWEAKLHMLQSMPYMPMANSIKNKVYQFLKITLMDQNKFVRAWTYNGFYELSQQYPEYLEETKQFFEMAMRDEAASVKARIRNIMKKGF